MDLCQYSDMLGVPNQGVHSYRIFGLAAIDVILLIVGALILYWGLNKWFGWNTSYVVYLVVFFVLGIILHRLFCVRTTIDKLLFD